MKQTIGCTKPTHSSPVNSTGRMKKKSGFWKTVNMFTCFLLTVLVSSAFVNAEPFAGKLKLLIIRCANSDCPSDSAVLAQYTDQACSTAVNEANEFFLKSSWNRVGVDSIGKGSVLVAGVGRTAVNDAGWYAHLYSQGIALAQTQGYNYQNFDVVLILWNYWSTLDNSDHGARTQDHNQIYFHKEWGSAVLIHELRHSLLWKAGQPHGEACGWRITPGSTNPLDASGLVGDYWDIPDVGGVQWMRGIPQIDNNACTKYELGWLTDNDVYPVMGNQDYSQLIRLYPIDSAQNPDAKSCFAVYRNCLDPNNPDLNQMIWGEFRTRFTGIPSIEKGILLHLGPCNKNWGSTTLLDMSMRTKNPPDPSIPGTASWAAQTTYLGSFDGQDVGLSVGRTFNDYPSKIHITPWVVNSNPKTMMVFVNTGDFANDNPPNGHVTFSGNIIDDTLEGITYPNRSIYLNANGTDPDNDPIAYYWTFGDGTHSTNNSMVVEHSWATTGTYSVSCEISDLKGHMVLAMGTVHVYDTPPQAPTGVFCSYVTPYSGSTVKIDWTDHDTTVAGYSVIRMDKDNNILSGINIPSGAIQSCIDSGLVANTQYNYKVQAYNAKNCWSDYSNIAAIQTMALPPDAPDGLTATVVSSTQIDLTWLDHDNTANETGYTFKMAVGDSGFKDFGAGSAGLTRVSASPLTPNTTYRFIVCVSNPYGSSCSNIATATTLDVLPAAPTGLTATAASSSQIDLSWVDNSSNETGFYIEQAASSSGPFTQIASVGANVTSWQNTGLKSNTTYWYRVRSYNDIGNSENSNVTSAKTLNSAPNVPTSFKATPASSTQINLIWEDTSTNESGFYIEQAASSSGPFTQIGSVGANVTSYQITGLTPNTTYWYRVRSYNDVGKSGYSITISGTTASSTITAPAYLGASLASATQAALWWNDNSNNETGFLIEQATNSSGPWTQIGSTSANTTHFTTSSNLSPVTTYYYRVRANNSNDYSNYSNTASVKTQDVPPASPSTVKVTAVSSSKIDISWTDNAENEIGFYLERSTTGSGSWNQLAILGANVTTYSDIGLQTGTTYWYRVRAYNNLGISGYSSTASTSTYSNLAPNGTVTASSEQQGNYASNAKDNNSGTRWAASSGTMPQWWKVDLGSSKNIHDFEVTFERTGTTGDCYDYKIETSDDNITWTTQVDRTNNTDVAQVQYPYFIGKARYVRITINDAPGNNYASMYEFKVFGK